MVEMMRRFPNFYADTSALNTPFRSAAIQKALRTEMRGRMLHGSDFPVPVGAWYVCLRGIITPAQRRQAAQEENLIERDAMLKRMCGFDESHFTTLGEVLRPWP
jgi:predicted TIM-barrel fold metal-dependent hydrolase